MVPALKGCRHEAPPFCAAPVRAARFRNKKLGRCGGQSGCRRGGSWRAAAARRRSPPSPAAAAAAGARRPQPRRSPRPCLRQAKGRADVSPQIVWRKLLKPKVGLGAQWFSLESSLRFNIMGFVFQNPPIHCHGCWKEDNTVCGDESLEGTPSATWLIGLNRCVCLICLLPKSPQFKFNTHFTYCLPVVLLPKYLRERNRV